MSLASDLLRARVGDSKPEWKRRRLRDVVKLVNGYPFASDAFGPNGHTPLVRIRDLFSSSFETYVSGHVPRQAMIRNGDVLIGMDGDFNVAVWKRGAAALNQRLCLLRPRESVDMRFIAYALPSILKIINDLTFSTTVKHLSSGDLLNERLMMPPLQEQRRIADFLEEETSRIDAIVRIRQRQLFLVDERRQSAVQGLFARSRSGALTRMKYLLAQRPTYGVLVPEFVDEGVPFIRVQDLGYLQQEGLELRKIPRSLSAQYRRTSLREGDVLVSVVGTLGRAAIVPPSLAGANVNRAIACLRAAPHVDRRLLVAWLGTQDFQAQALDATASDSAQRTLGMADLANFTLRWPQNSEEQRRMSAEVAAVDRGWRALRTSIERQIRLLAERRRGLIIAAVTGKIDVATAGGVGL